MADRELKPGDPFMDNSSFEGLFVRAIQPQGEFLEALRAVGYDPDWPKTRYHGQVWLDALEVARRHLFPNLPPDEGFRQLGSMTMDGFLKTIIGRIAVAAAPFLSLEAMLKRIPDQAAQVSSIQIEVVTKAPGQWVLRYRTAYANPDFTLGMMQRGFERKATVRIGARSNEGFELLVGERV